MVSYNAITINGKSSKDLGFFVGVEENSPPQMPKKKDKFYDLEKIDGLLVQEIEAYEPVKTKFIMYLYNATNEDIRKFKSFIGYKGKYTSFDNPNVERRFYESDIKFENGVTNGSYQVEVTFTCEPFEYSKNITTYTCTNTGSINYKGTAPSYPIVTVSGIDGSEEILQIGKRQMTIKNGLSTGIKIDCRIGGQNVSVGGILKNSYASGDFFVIKNGTNNITASSGITSIKVEYQEAYL